MHPLRTLCTDLLQKLRVGHPSTSDSLEPQAHPASTEATMQATTAYDDQIRAEELFFCIIDHDSGEEESTFPDKHASRAWEQTSDQSLELFEEHHDVSEWLL